ncbi:hypothetical protein IFR04_005854 [Cadophora malorum]|uniref:RTA1-domain-containing protein n=1 Tax=Cadophora malorum TaxID=108018 RepID=A0A8H7W8D9_9HELO|nr:hypothetical protein IFR04_005854 [Cadophora malorum]
MSNSTTDAAPKNLYHYEPNANAALVAAALFGLSSVIHLVVMIKKRTFFYTAMTVGAFMMTGGYAARYLSAKSPDKVMLYVAQSLLILLPPSLYAATIYMIYGRIVLLVNAPDASVIRPTRVTKIFVIGDILAFFIQSAGGGMMAQEGKAELGKTVLLTGLGVQLVFFGFFLLIAIIFDHRMTQSPMRHIIPKYGKHSWRKLLVLLLGAAVIIVVRCLYRIAEYVLGTDGYLLKHEWCAYSGDTIPMLVVQIAFHVVHAGDVFPKPGEEKQVDESYISLTERV